MCSQGVKVRRSWSFVFVGFIALSLAACGGGGGGGGTTPPTSGGSPIGGSTATPIPTPSPTATPTPAVISGKIVSIPNTAFGPNAPQTGLAGVIVIVGPTLILGSTPPPTLLPAGDVQATTQADGSYNVSLSAGPVAPDASPNALFVVPGQDLSGATPPKSGYYVSVFAVGTDGKIANVPLPVHAFSAVTAGVLATQRVTTATVDEAANLAYFNAARVKANPSASPLTFDEIAQEVAREHVQDEAANRYDCHFDQKNVGPESRYLRMSGLGANGENLGIVSNGGSSQSAYALIVDAEVKEGPGGGHYDNLVAATRIWAGVSIAAESNGVQHSDEELVEPHQAFQFIYHVAGGCPSGVVNNNS